ncbi:MAG: hypothetical protein NW205_02705 [Hyphomicrobiaceae bacterium]|nr:hypothetical protein [Hyphomicrobiaceae bacterium]
MTKTMRPVFGTGAAGQALARAEAGGTSSPSAGATRASPPELLVGYGFRGWIAGYQTGDVGCWEKVWRLYASHLGADRAELAVGSLAAWAKSVNAACRSPLRVRPLDACGFCRDECLAISMVAASQHDTCPAMRACAYALIDSSLVDDVLHQAETYAVMMRSIDQVVPPTWIVNANAFVDPAASYPH